MLLAEEFMNYFVVYYNIVKFKYMSQIVLLPQFLARLLCLEKLNILHALPLPADEILEAVRP